MHPFKHDFYGHEMSVLVLGYIRPELDYISKGGYRLEFSYPPYRASPATFRGITLTRRGSYRRHPI